MVGWDVNPPYAGTEPPETLDGGRTTSHLTTTPMQYIGGRHGRGKGTSPPGRRADASRNTHRLFRIRAGTRRPTRRNKRGYSTRCIQGEPKLCTRSTPEAIPKRFQWMGKRGLKQRMQDPHGGHTPPLTPMYHARPGIPVNTGSERPYFAKDMHQLVALTRPRKPRLALSVSCRPYSRDDGTLTSAVGRRVLVRGWSGRLGGGGALAPKAPRNAPGIRRNQQYHASTWAKTMVGTVGALQTWFKNDGCMWLATRGRPVQ